MAGKSVRSRKNSKPELDYCSLVEQSVLGVIILQDQRVVFANQKIADLTGINQEQLQQYLIEDIKSFFHPKSREQEWEDLLGFIAGDNLPAHREMRIRHRSGSYSWVEMVLGKVEHGDRTALQVTMIDITARKQAEKDLRYRLGIEELVATLSSRFLNLPLINLEKEIQRMLRLIGKFTCVERSFVFLLAADSIHIANIFEWHAEGVHPIYPHFVGKSVHPFKWAVDKLKRLQTVYLTNPTVPSESANSVIRLQQLSETRSLLAIPLMMGESLIGCLGFSSEHFEKNWTDGDLKLLRMVGEILANVLLRKQMEEEVYQSEARYRAVVETQTEMILRWGTEGQVIFSNEAFKRCFNLAGGQLDIQNILSLIHPVDTELLLDRLTALGADLPEQETEFRLLKPDGEVRWLHWNNRAILNQERHLTEIQSVGRDITDIKRDEEELRQSYQKLAQTVNSLEHQNREITLISEMGDLLQSCLNIEEANEVFAQFARQLFPDFSGALYLFDVERDVLESTASWGENLQTEHEFLARDCWAMRRGRPYVIENTEAALLCDHINKSEPKNICPYQCVPMIAQGETLGMLYLQETCPNNIETLANQGPLAVMVAERMGMALSNLKLREAIKYQASHDRISGLLNRQVLEETLNQELHSAAHNHQSLVVLLLDINRFDRYNITYGFDIGDALLSEIGALLQNNSSKTEISFRRGGDQFALIMLNSTCERTRQRALVLQDDISRLKIMADRRYAESVTIRFGMAGFPQDGSTTTALLHAAEQSLININN